MWRYPLLVWHETVSYLSPACVRPSHWTGQDRRGGTGRDCLCAQCCGFPVVTNINACGRQWLCSPAQRARCLFRLCELLAAHFTQHPRSWDCGNEFICVKRNRGRNPPLRGPSYDLNKGFLIGHCLWLVCAVCVLPQLPSKYVQWVQCVEQTPMWCRRSFWTESCLNYPKVALCR